MIDPAGFRESFRDRGNLDIGEEKFGLAYLKVSSGLLVVARASMNWTSGFGGPIIKVD